MKSKPILGINPFVCLCAVALTSALPVQAALFSKNNSPTALNTATSWTNNAVPGSADTAQWDSNVTDPTTVTNTLGASMTWNGINVFNPAASVTIVTNTGGNMLTLGVGGINLFQASEGLTLNNNTTISAPEYWQIGNNQSLTVGGALVRNRGTAVLFSFDNTSAQATIATNVPGTVVTTNNMVLLDGPVGPGGSADGSIIATYNDTDFAALNYNNQVVGGATLSGLYTANPSGAAPTLGSAIVYDFNNTNSYGGRVAGTYYIDGFRFNTPQFVPSSANTFTYGGVGSWEVLFKAGNTLDVNTVLVTTNVGNSYVVFGSGGYVRTADSLNEFLIYQNNPGASLVFQSPITERIGGSYVTKLGAGTMEMQAVCGYTGGTLVNGGTLLLDGVGSLGIAPLTVNPGGNFEGQSGATNYAPALINNGGTNSVLIAAANGQFINKTNLTFAAGTTWLQFVYSNTIAPSTTTPALLVPVGVLTASNTVNINVLTHGLAVGQYPLLKYATLVTNSASSVSPFVLANYQPHVSAYLSNNVANQSIDLVVTSVNDPLQWTGLAGNGLWDIGISTNWQDALGNPTTYGQVAGLSDAVVFNDAASGSSPISITINTNIIPASIVVSNYAKNYVFTGSGTLGGSGSLTKGGSGTLTLSTANTFTGGLNLNSGTVSFSAQNNLGSGAINFNGGTLAYASGNTADISSQVVTFGAGGATINDGGNSITFAGPVGNNGTGGFTKLGAGSLTLNDTNKYSGNTVVGAGTLVLAYNAFITNSAAIIINSGAGLDATAGGMTLVNQVLEGSGTLLGEIILTNTAVISPATNGAYGTITITGDLDLNGGTNLFDISTTNKDQLVVSGNLYLEGSLNSGTILLNVHGSLTNGTYKLISYGGSFYEISPLTVAGFSSPGQLATLSYANANEIDLIISSSGTATAVWSGNAGSSWDVQTTESWLIGGSPAYYADGDAVVFNDTSSNPNVSLAATLYPSSVVINATNDSYFFNGSGQISGSASLTLNGPATTTITTANNNTGPTTLNNGAVLMIGYFSGGDVGSGNITNNGGTLIFNQYDGNTHTVGGQISGTGSVVAEGSSPIVLAANNTYSGLTTISNSFSSLQIGTGGASGSLGTSPVVDNGALILDSGAGSYALTNNISGAGRLILNGTASVTLSSTNSYLGNTYISNGIVKLTASEEIPDGNTVAGSTGWLILDGSAGGAGVFDLNGFNETVNALSGAAGTVNGLVTNSGASSSTFTVLNDATTTYNGEIGGNLSLIVSGANELRLNSPNTYTGTTLVEAGATLGVGPGATAGAGGITLSNSIYYMHNNGGTAVFPPDNISIPAGTIGSINSGELGNGYAGLISGPASATNAIIGPVSFGTGNYEQYSNFFGTVLIGTGGTLRFASTSLTLNGGDHAIFDLEGTGVLQTRNAGTVNLGGLEGDGTISNPQANIPTGNFALGLANSNTYFNGTITGSNAIVKMGTGTQTFASPLGTNLYTLDNVNYYSNLTYVTTSLDYAGATTVSNGVLQLVAPVALTNSYNGTTYSAITLASATAVLDASSMGYISNEYASDGVTLTNELLITNGLFEVVSGQSLSGIGTIRAAKVRLDAGSLFNVGLAYGSLTATNNVELAGTVNLSVNATNTPTSSELIAQSITIDSTATLNVTNLGSAAAAPSAPVVFQLFNHPVSGFAAVTLPVFTGAILTNELAVNGSLVLLPSTIVPTVPPAITGFTFANGNLTITGTNAQAGGTYYLLTTTNLLNARNLWTVVATNVISTANSFTFVGTNAITPGLSQQYYILSSTNN